MNKMIIPYIDAQNQLQSYVVQLAINYANTGADEIIIYDYSKDEVALEKLLYTVKEVTKEVEIPITIGLYAPTFEEMKKAVYTGATKVMCKHSLIESKEVISSSVKRFGEDKFVVEVDTNDILSESFVDEYKDSGICRILLKHIPITTEFKNKVAKLSLPVIIRDSLSKNDLYELITMENVIGVSTNYFELGESDILGVIKNKDIMKAKLALKKQQVNVNTYESCVSFLELKKNSEDMVPVIVQDYKSNEVLMLAYMNEEAFNKTIETGKMTYYSRSRNELWVKGLTSGHIQYVKSLTIDCDSDTILAKVYQIGAACHTGNRSCFYTPIVKKNEQKENPLTVLEDLYKTVIDRKKNPKEGSYTNYLLEKGIDKILKKCGEESAEIIIAAKNPNKEEVKYEIADFLYHLEVLMVECNVDWDDITKELANRK